MTETAVSEALPRRATAWGVVRKYINIYRVSLMERMAYRGDFLLATFLRFLPLVTTILLWRAAYDWAPEPKAGEVKRFQGFTFGEMVAYLMLVHISRMFSSMPGLAGGIARDVREGTLKKYLIQPLDLIGYLLSYRAAHKTAYIVTSVIPYAILFAVFVAFLQDVHAPDAVRAVAYVVSLLLAFGVGFYFETCVGLVGFWFLEITSFLYVVNTVNFFVSGQLFPIDLLPSPWREIFRMLPFQYMAYFPAAVVLGKVPTNELLPGLLIEAAWAAALAVLARLLYARGLRRYSAFGG
ncbi:MAG TPA: ABC-2 family transporter protein [Gemmataceae bacterium]|nr:ABC-2 family transporter protein [Gemmataceae bacterium]